MGALQHGICFVFQQLTTFAAALLICRNQAGFNVVFPFVEVDNRHAWPWQESTHDVEETAEPEAISAQISVVVRGKIVKYLWQWKITERVTCWLCDGFEIIWKLCVRTHQECKHWQIAWWAARSNDIWPNKQTPQDWLAMVKISRTNCVSFISRKTIEAGWNFWNRFCFEGVDKSWRWE